MPWVTGNGSYDNRSTPIQYAAWESKASHGVAAWKPGAPGVGTPEADAHLGGRALSAVSDSMGQPFGGDGEFHQQMSRSAPVCGGRCPRLITRIPVRHVPVVIASIIALMRVTTEESFEGARCCARPATRMDACIAGGSCLSCGCHRPVSAGDGYRKRRISVSGHGGFGTRFRHGVPTSRRCTWSSCRNRSVLNVCGNPQRRASSSLNDHRRLATSQ